jgi:Domain of unknown function (DUF5655)/Bacteriocin-protection, YdeI or OmpD-Associated/Domain of unknown function (DUF1905)
MIAAGDTMVAAGPSVKGHFRGKTAAVADTYAAILDAARALGPVREEPKKTSIHLVRASAFAGVAVQKAALVLTLKSDRDIRSPRIRKREQASANRWHVEVRLERPDEVDDDIRQWLTRAYSLAGAKEKVAADVSAASKTFKTTIVREGGTCFIPLTFDPKGVFGKVRAPVKVTLNGYTYRSTIASMGGPACLPLRRSHREAAGLEGGETIAVRLDLDTEIREVTPPADLVKALHASSPAWERWQALSYSHQREHVEAIEGVKKPETRARRIQAAIGMMLRTRKSS